MCAGGTRDAGGSGASPPPGFGCPSQGGACVCVCASTLSSPSWSALPGNILYGAGVDSPSFPALHKSWATCLEARKARGKKKSRTKILGSPPPPPKSKAQSNSLSWVGAPPAPRTLRPWGVCLLGGAAPLFSAEGSPVYPPHTPPGNAISHTPEIFSSFKLLHCRPSL